MFGRDRGAENLVLPISVGCTHCACIEAQRGCCLLELTGIQYLVFLLDGRYSDIAIVGNGRSLTCTSLLGGDDDDTIRSTRTIDGCCRSILQYSKALDIVRVNHRQRVTHTTHTIVVNSQTINHIERLVGSIQRGTATDANLSTCTRFTTFSQYVHTGNLTYQHIRGTTCDTL